jgi:methylated-DNA-[protein]-cysteine S-methyltransferase
VPGFNRRVYEYVCTIPRGETRTYHEIAKALGASGAAHSVAQAVAKNPYMLIVPCHRALEAGNYTDRLSPYGGVISKRRLLALEGAHPVASKTLFEVLLPVAPPRPST